MNITGKKENTQQKKHDWKKFEKNDLTIALCTKNEKIYPAYASKHKANRENEDLFFL